jgi:hypothetical protein
MSKIQISPVWQSVTLIAVMVGAIASMACGYHLGSSNSSALAATASERVKLNQQFQQVQNQIPLRLQADSASGGKSISMATGPITNDVEGLYILDHLTGGLQCWLLNPRTGDVGGIYVADVNSVLGLDKGDPDFVMTTGKFYIKSQGNMKVADTIVYVGEGKSGKVAGFSLAYDKGGIQRGVVQQGELTVVCQGPIRNATIRE